MRNEIPGEDPKKIWRNQRAESSIMTPAMLQQKARKLQTRTRRELAANTALAVVVLVISGFGIARAAEVGVRVVFGIAIAWALSGQYFLHRGMGGTLSEDASGLAFYRQEIRRKRELFHRVLQWSFGPVVLAIGGLIFVLTGIAETRGLSARAVLPFGTAFVIWIVGLFIQRARRQRELLREVDELADAERNAD